MKNSANVSNNSGEVPENFTTFDSLIKALVEVFGDIYYGKGSNWEKLLRKGEVLSSIADSVYKIHMIGLRHYEMLSAQVMREAGGRVRDIANSGVGDIAGGEDEKKN